MGIPMYEDVIEPDLEICDPHHHLGDFRAYSDSPYFVHMTDRRYLIDELVADLGQGHRVTKTVFLEGGVFYRADGPADIAPLGEVEFANGIAAIGASGHYGEIRPCAGIVSQVDLSLGATRVGEILDAHQRAAGVRLKGVRNGVAFDPTGTIPPASDTRNGLLYRESVFRQGVRVLGDRGLRFEGWCFHQQFGEFADLARDLPDVPMILDHLGTPLGVGPYAARRDEVFAQWKAGMAELAICPNVYIKVGGLGMFMTGFNLPDRTTISSAQVADAYRPYVESAIEMFGVDRCMFESNSPVDSASGYGILWNAFKRLAGGCSAEEKAKLFHDTAVKFYGLD